MATRDCPSCGTFLVVMKSTDRGPRWRCFGGAPHEFELGPGRELVAVDGRPAARVDEVHRAKVAATIQRATRDFDDLERLSHL
jgi:hypothetical protein